ncbi:hypothetical protein [Psychroflexus sp. ALD_RP9]|uniref:hypothetical protein n=1 Tax=Psychroflexus sp. ALD_RP9 TaxID=2777186 RepID=UPI001A903BC1|nr:hypothetical protein [Psychroflexus sp. ALD_RP9]QSS97867.1 hypothetical protein IMZ30_03920 [Psychroflexus sp. ALD_RP9]
MKKFFFILVLLPIFGISQNNLKSGKIVFSDGFVRKGLINDVNWRDAFTQIDFKLNENAKTESFSVDEVDYFMVDGEKYKSANVKLNTSAIKDQKLSNTKEPKIIEKTVFVKVLAESNSIELYQVYYNYIPNYLLSQDDEITTLIYHRYVKQGKIFANNQFRNQLYRSLDCLEASKYRKYEYKADDLLDLLKAHFKCKEIDDALVLYNKDTERIEFNIRPKLGVITSQVTSDFTAFENFKYEISPDRQTNISFGVEFEFLLPFRSKSYSIFIEPTYVSNSSTARSPVVEQGPGLASRSAEVFVDYQAIEVPIGVKKYFRLNSNSNLFIAGSGIFALNLDSTLEARFISNNTEPRAVFNFDVKNIFGFGLNLGYELNNKYSIELKYSFNREIEDIVGFASKYNHFGVYLGYKIL